MISQDEQQVFSELNDSARRVPAAIAAIGRNKTTRGFHETIAHKREQRNLERRMNDAYGAPYSKRLTVAILRINEETTKARTVKFNLEKELRGEDWVVETEAGDLAVVFPKTDRVGASAALYRVHSFLRFAIQIDEYDLRYCQYSSTEALVKNTVLKVGR